jgi:hypothetical protein
MIQDKDSASRVVKEGFVKKRSGRMHQWTNRYFLLTQNSISYKLKQDSPAVRSAFDLVPGCVVTDINEDSLVKMKSNKMFSFWVVWPKLKCDKDKEDKNEESDDSDDEAVRAGATTTSSSAAAVLPSGTTTESVAAAPNRKLQDIVRNEVNTQKRKKEMAVEQLEVHHQHDSNVSNGAMIAAVAVGGVVVGALTMVRSVVYNVCSRAHGAPRHVRSCFC